MSEYSLYQTCQNILYIIHVRVGCQNIFYFIRVRVGCQNTLYIIHFRIGHQNLFHTCHSRMSEYSLYHPCQSRAGCQNTLYITYFKIGYQNSFYIIRPAFTYIFTHPTCITRHCYIEKKKSNTGFWWHIGCQKMYSAMENVLTLFPITEWTADRLCEKYIDSKLWWNVGCWKVYIAMENVLTSCIPLQNGLRIGCAKSTLYISHSLSAVHSVMGYRVSEHSP